MLRPKSLFLLFVVVLFSLGLTFPSVGACPGYCLESCNDAMTTVDNFTPGEEVYVKGSGLEPTSSYKIYIVEDYTSWVRGTTTLADLTVVMGPIEVTTDATGLIVDQPVLIWASASPGYYDIFADCQTDGTIGTYDAYDDMDDLDVDNAGFFVIPEMPLGTITGLLACFIAIAFKCKRIS